jgi:hypothetical protein
MDCCFIFAACSVHLTPLDMILLRSYALEQLKINYTKNKLFNFSNEGNEYIGYPKLLISAKSTVI